MTRWWHARRTSQRARIGGSLLALLLTVVALAGCGSEPEANPSGLTRYYDINELITAVAAQQRVDRTARFSLRGELVGAETLGASATLRFTGEGLLQITDSDVSLRFTQIVTQPGATPQETGFVVLPGSVFLRLPADAADPSGKPWVRVDPSSTDPEAQQRIALANSMTQRADPTGTLASYAASTLVTDASDDVIEGDPAVRYTIVTDLGRAAELQPDPAVRAQLEQQVRGGLTHITSTLWVDADHRPLRSAARQDLPGIGTLAITSSYRDWGQDAQIDPPPAELVR